nr:succinate--CoA ligase [GDP-forming] subunit beta, mitochondrial-like [Onthophagus taurus]
MEYQSKQILKGEGLKMSEFITIDQVKGYKDFENFLSERYVVKAQVAAGGRGLGYFKDGLKGGVQVTTNKDQARDFIKQMLGHNLITKQTSKNGLRVRTVMVEQAATVSKEAYFSYVLNPQFKDPIMMICPAGGVDVETITKQNPSLMRKIPVDICKGFSYEQAGEYADFFRFKRMNYPQLIDVMQKLWRLFKKYDMMQLEINPLAETNDNKIQILDAKFTIDNNAEFRHKDLFKPDPETHPNELEAVQFGMHYIQLDGNIGCMVNGAGLAMATMDLIKTHGGEPANFLDVSGGVTESGIYNAFKILGKSRQVKVILVNIFGGIVDCAMIAKGIVKATEIIKVPLVVRLEGTHADEAREIIKSAHFPIDSTDSFEQAALKAVVHAKKSSYRKKEDKK